MALGTRKRKQTRTFGAESPMAKPLTRYSRSSKYSNAMHGELSRKEERIIVRSWERLGTHLVPAAFSDMPVFSIDCSNEQHVTCSPWPSQSPGTLSGKLKRIRSRFLFLAWTLVQTVEAPALVTSFVVLCAVNVEGDAESTSIGALVCSAELLVPI
jgi:hypothetical protein